MYPCTYPLRIQLLAHTKECKLGSLLPYRHPGRQLLLLPCFLIMLSLPYLLASPVHTPRRTGSLPCFPAFRPPYSTKPLGAPGKFTGKIAAPTRRPGPPWSRGRSGDKRRHTLPSCAETE
eukprot:1140913-Pelagomonas_calceolata.AAC.3